MSINYFDLLQEKELKKIHEKLFYSYEHRHYDEVNENSLFLKLSIHLFGISKELDPEDEELINRLKTLIIQNSNSEIYLGIIYIVINEINKNENVNHLVFKVGKKKAILRNALEYDNYNYDNDNNDSNNFNCVFIDTWCCVYQNWEDYLHNNKLPPCHMCYPINGVYKMEKKHLNLVVTKKSPSTVEKMFSFGDEIAPMCEKIGLGLTLPSLFFPYLTLLPKIGRTLITVSNSYEVCRGVQKLKARFDHNQSLTDDDTCKEWLSLALNTSNVLFKPAPITACASYIVKHHAYRFIIPVIKDFTFVVSVLVEGCWEITNKFIKVCCHVYNVVISKDMAERVIKIIHMMGIKVLTIGYIKLNKNIYDFLYVTEDGAPFRKLLEYVLGPRLYSLYKFMLVTESLETSVIKLQKCINLETGNLSQKIDSVTQEFEEFWSTYKKILAEKKKLICDHTLKFDYKPNKDCSNSKLEPLNFLELFGIRSLVRDTAEKFGYDQTNEEIAEKEKLIFDKFKLIDSSKNLHEYFIQLQAFCQHVLLKFSKYQQSGETYYTQPNTKNFLFSVSLEISDEELKEIKSDFENKIKSEDMYNFQDLKWENIELFDYPSNGLNEYDYLKYASKVSNCKFYKRNSRIIRLSNNFTIVQQEFKNPVYIFEKKDDIHSLGFALIVKK
uniref:DUF4781 domain-containing protein n=1 Tax=Clastoptera arizonana TaxID=38151 RepID=A0A1B6E915_9HEMI